MVCSNITSAIIDLVPIISLSEIEEKNKERKVSKNTPGCGLVHKELVVYLDTQIERLLQIASLLRKS